MSTHAAIFIKTETSYRGIHCQHDGYCIGVGKVLQTHYQDPEKIKALIDLGNISGLRERVDPIGRHSLNRPESGTTLAYHRDGGEPKEDNAPIELEDFSDLFNHYDLDAEYVYLYADGMWQVRHCTDYGPRPLSEVLEEIERPGIPIL